MQTDDLIINGNKKSVESRAESIDTKVVEYLTCPHLSKAATKEEKYYFSKCYADTKKCDILYHFNMKSPLLCFKPLDHIDLAKKNAAITEAERERERTNSIKYGCIIAIELSIRQR